jgi:uncharacterized protein YybS (DUF2232 family)
LFWTDLIAAIISGVVFTAIFAIGFRRGGPWSSLPPFFIIVFLGAWAGALWLKPLGPAVFGVSWLNFLLVGLFVSLVLAAAEPCPAPIYYKKRGQKQPDEASALATLDVFFWLLVILLAVAVVWGY